MSSHPTPTPGVEPATDEQCDVAATWISSDWLVRHTKIEDAAELLPALLARIATQRAAIVAAEKCIGEAEVRIGTDGRELTLLRDGGAKACEALERLAIVERHRMASGGGTIWYGMRCRACDTNSEDGSAIIEHKPECPLCARTTFILLTQLVGKPEGKW